MKLPFHQGQLCLNICVFQTHLVLVIKYVILCYIDEEALIPVTMWVVCDLETPEGRDLLYSAIKRLVRYRLLGYRALFKII